MMRQSVELLSYLRVAVERPVPIVVMAGVGEGASASTAVAGLAAAARECGLRMAVAELAGTAGRLMLRQRRLRAGELPAHEGMPAESPDGPALGAALQAQSTAAQLESWLQRSGADFVLVEAPPLALAADAALLARICDGLVLVVEPAVTSREALRRAVRLAETSRCRLIGLVMREERRALPSWLRRLLGGTNHRG
jgi:polysaccharide biosynthesis transport protein